MQIKEISVVESIESAGPLLVEHWEEIARNKEVMVLKPNIPVYRALEDSGCLIGLGAFDGDRMVGYCVSIVTAHLHYADLIYTSNDVIFISATHRGSSAGIRLMRETERIAKDERGSQLMLWHAKPGTALVEILPRMGGYAVQDVIYSKTL